MERRALVLALALTLPLALYGVPYAYAATTQSTYIVTSDSRFIAGGHVDLFSAHCSSPLDVTQHFGIHTGSGSAIDEIVPTVNGLLMNSIGPVSYTHLTLPTICSV